MNNASNHDMSDSSGSEPVLTLDQLIQQVLGFDPKKAAQTNDSTLCCTDVASRVHIDGKSVDLNLIDRRYAIGYVRVSTERQRTQTEEKRASRKQKHYKQEGQSEAEQIERLVRYFAGMGWAFRIISDAAVTGEMPNNRPELIAKMLQRKARRYKTNFERCLLNSAMQWTPEQDKALRAYLKQRIDAILSGAAAGDKLDSLVSGDAAAIRRERGQGKKTALFRQGYSELLGDVENNRPHTIVTNEGSRICRDPDLHIHLLEICADHSVKLVGLMKDFLDIDIHQPMERAMAYMVSSFDAQHLDVISAHTFRGLVYSLQEGVPNGNLYFWLRRDPETGLVQVIPELKGVALSIVTKCIEGQGINSIWGDLKRQGVRIDDKPISHSQIDTVLSTPAILGRQMYFGIAWQTLPAIASEQEYEAMRQAVRARRDQIDNRNSLHDPRRWAIHALTYLMRCWCGRSLRRRFQTVDGKRFYYWDCPAKKENRPHARVTADRLEGFVYELCRHHPRILSGHFSAAGGEEGRQRQAQAALLQDRLAKAEANYARLRADAEKAAGADAVRLGFAAGAKNYGEMVELIVARRLERENAELESLREQVRKSNIETLQERQAESLRASLGQITDWNNLDEITRSRLMQAVFEKIIVQMTDRDGWIDLFLVGSSRALPPVPLTRGASHSLYLPSVEEWIAGFLTDLS